MVSSCNGWQTLAFRSVGAGIVLMQDDHAEDYPCGHGRVLRFR